MNMKKIITGIFATALMACSLSAFTATAANNNLAVRYMKGDLNGDGLINEADKVLLSNYVVGSITLNDENAVKAADVNWDGEVDIMDVIRMNKHIADISYIHTGNLNNDIRVTSVDNDILSHFLLGTGNIHPKYKYDADVNGDDKIDSNDLLLLTKYLLN